MKIITIAGVDRPTVDAHLRQIIQSNPSVMTNVLRRGYFENGRLDFMPDATLRGRSGSAEHVSVNGLVYLVVLQIS